MHKHATTNRLTQRVSAAIIVALACTGLVPAAATATGTSDYSSGDSSIVTVEGTLRAAVIHGDDHDSGHESEHGSEESRLAYAIQVDNAFLPLDAEDVPTDEVGADITAEVIVPQETANAVSPDIIDSGDVATEQDVQELADNSTTELSAASVTVLESAPVAAATTVGKTHSVHLVIVRSDGSAPNTTTAKGNIATASTYWKAATFGTVGAINVVKTTTTTINGYCTADPWKTWQTAATASGYTWKDYHHLVLIGPPCSGETLGIGTVGEAGLSSGGLVTVYGPSAETTIHELGHNFSLGHSNLATSYSLSPSSTSFNQAEYYGFFGPMAGGVGDGFPSSFLDPAYQHVLKVAPSGSIVSVPYTGQTLNLNAVTASSGVRGATFVDGFSGYRIFVEYRNGAGFDAKSFYTLQPNALVAQYNIAMGNGVRVTLLDEENNLYTFPTSSGSPKRATLRVGESLTGWGSGYTVKVNSMTAGTANVTISPGKAKPTVSAANPKAAFGATPKVTATVTATLGVAGKVEAKIAGKTVASKTLPTSGTRKVTLDLPKNLKVGTHTVELHYTGSDRITPGKRNVTLTVSKAKPAVKTALKNTTVGTAATLSVRVAANNVPTGKAQINIDGKKYRTVTLNKGRATVKLPKSLKLGKHRLAVVYAGDSGHSATTLRRDFTVKKQRAAITGLKGGTRSVKKKATYKDTFTISHAGVLQRYSNGSWRTVKKLKAGKNTLSHRSTTASTTKYRVVIGSTSKRVGAKKTVAIRVK
ncbi:Ig-like domain repeat protein [Jonesia quinghaiensis]|uniref:Ig-like domain repeat protein n=1 Tax=Jonesia quinghaiensis TaxID=262806 RepID=UPI00048AFFD9|nr:Ig-like domain repeat protein [Jonesia quinghaiensis]